MRGAAATRSCICRSGSAASICRRSRRSTCAREGPPRGRFIAPRLAEAVKIALERGEQALLFLNRRGFAPLTLCRACGHPHRLPELRRLAGRSPLQAAAGLPPLRLLDAAAGRSARNARRRTASSPVGPGVERLEQEAAELFPDSAHPGAVERSGRIDGAAARRNSTTSREGRFDIVIGTQLVAKGHHFPKLNLVGIVDADLGLANGDPRAAERTFQLLHQVVGRAGREEGRGIGFLQTHQPEHPVMRALIAQDREAFYAAEIELREKTGYPPFGRLASLLVSGADKHADRKLCAPARGGRAARRATCACSVPPRRRSRWCAAAIASACW